jgi:hypothetical protein
MGDVIFLPAVKEERKFGSTSHLAHKSLEFVSYCNYDSLRIPQLIPHIHCNTEGIQSAILFSQLTAVRLKQGEPTASDGPVMS